MDQPKLAVDREKLANSSLKEKDGSICPKCNLAYYGKVDKCTKCNSATEHAKWYKRFCLERLVFILSVGIIMAILMPFLTDDPDTKWQVPFGTVIGLFSLYFTGNYFFGMGSFFENFRSDQVPERAYLKFSYSRLFTEIFRVLGIALGLVVVFGVIALIRSISK